MKKMLFLAAVVLFFAGCATYGAKGMMPNLGDSSVDRTKLSTKIGDGIVVTVYPITTKEEIEKYFDEDLLSKGVLPVFVLIENEGVMVNLVAVTLNLNNNTIPAMTPGDLFGVIKRDWGGRAIFWMFPTYFVGAPISAVATYYTNTGIKEDLGVEGDKGKLLRFGKVEKGVMSGFLCFRIPEKNAGQKVLKFIFQQGGKLIEYNLNVN